MKVSEIKDLPDGSGIISFELTDKEKTSLIQFALLEIIKRRIEETNKEQEYE